MRKRMIAFLSIGIISVLLGVVGAVLERINIGRLADISVALRIIPVFLVSIGGALIAVVISSRGGKLIKDEMVVRVEHISGHYAFNVTLFFICVLAFVHFFCNLTFSISELLLAMMLFMGFSNVLIRYLLMRQGKVE
jgi:hypothetical protein